MGESIPNLMKNSLHKQKASQTQSRINTYARSRDRLCKDENKENIEISKRKTTDNAQGASISFML